MGTLEYPLTLNEIKTGDRYQSKDPLTEEWSEVKEIYGMSYCNRTYLQYLINRKGIRLIKNE